VLAKAVYAGVMCRSFALASEALWQLAEIDVSTKQVERRTREIGTERCRERDVAADAYGALTLVERKGVPTGTTAPDLAVVEMDGGRLQIRERTTAGDKAVSAGERTKKGTHWREDKIGVLASMTSACHASDPCPTIPNHFVDASRIEQLVKEIKANAKANLKRESSGDTTAIAGDPSASDELASDESASDESATAPEYDPPELLTRSVVATKQEAHRFGELLACAAWQRGFYGSSRRAFLGDGSGANWGVWERHFSSFTPIVDFIHALTYVYQGAMAGGSFAAGWSRYTAWIAALWSGDVDTVLAGLDSRRAEVGNPDESDEETSPRRKLAESARYLRNQRERMQYAAYRTAGLPITTSHVESTVKQVNRRVKGTEMFWSESGSEAILQLRADQLSETKPLDAFWSRRAERTTGDRRYPSRDFTKTLSA